MNTQSIFIDTDMGNDDIQAICMILLQKSIAINGISIVNGVSGAEKGYQNAFRILKYLNKNIPLNCGSSSALKEKLAQFPLIDRQRAEELILLNLPRSLDIENPINENISIEDFIFVNSKNTLLVALGPLTNIAKTLQKYGNDFTKNIKGILMMGGGIKKGNVQPYFEAEYNIWLDPEAANIVFSSNIPITMVGIDATAYVPATSTFSSQIANIIPTTLEGNIIQQIILNNNNDFDCFYDQLAVSILFQSSIIEKALQGSIQVELEENKRGKTVFTPSDTGNTTAIMEIKPNLFYQLIIKLITNDKA